MQELLRNAISKVYTIDMKKYLLPALIVALGPLTTLAFDFSSEFKVYDSNKNGNIERVEFEDQLARFFDHLDKNRDAWLTTEEINAKDGWHQRLHAHQKAKPINIVTFIGLADALFDQADSDKNRKLSSQEFKTLDPKNFLIGKNILPRLCLGDVDHVALSWTLLEHGPKKKIQRYATLVPQAQTWTCLPLPHADATYTVKVMNHHRQICEVEIKKNQWVLVKQNGKSNKELKCTIDKVQSN